MSIQNKTKRSDQSIAIYGVLGISALGLAGYITLLGLGRDVPSDLLAVVVAAGVSGVLGWARGGTYYDDTDEVVPSPPGVPVQSFIADKPVEVEVVTPPAPKVYPNPEPEPEPRVDVFSEDLSPLFEAPARVEKSG